MQPKFELGLFVATPGAMSAVGVECLAVLLARHESGDWGEVDPEDAEENERALIAGNRLLSSYWVDAADPTPGEDQVRVWLITEADRSVTTALLPEEY